MKQKHFLLAAALCLMTATTATAQQYPEPAANVPLQLINNSLYADEDIYVAIIGQYSGTADNRQGGRNRWIYYDLANNTSSDAALKELTTSVNTLHKKAGDQGYANVFTTLDKIRNKTIYLAHTYGCRLLFGFKSPMYLHSTGTGYAGADLNNPTDPNAGIRWENLEFTYDWFNVIFANTTRVDCFQYPMGVEVFGTSRSNNAYMKAGETANYAQIIGDFNSAFASTDFSQCYQNRIKADNLGGIIINPSKVSSITDDYFDDYINDFWTYFTSHTLNVDLGNIFGHWTGSVVSGMLTMTRASDGTVCKMQRPSTKDIMECSGTMAAGSPNEKQFEAQLCGAFNRGAIDMTESEQQWQNTANFFRDGTTYNPYVKFLHDTSRTYKGYTYAFAYDDTGDNSATVATSYPERMTVTIGGFAADKGAAYDDNNGGGDDPDNPDKPDKPSVETPAGSGTTPEGLKYHYTITQDGTTATITFTVDNSSDFIGLVAPWQRDYTNGFLEKPQGETATYTYPAGTTVTFGCKWAYAGGATETGELTYTMKTSTAINNVVTPVSQRRAGIYDLSGRRVATLVDGQPSERLSRGIYIVDGRKLILK